MTSADTGGSPTVAVIHATAAAMPPTRTAFAERFPEARIWNLLDDRLITEAEAAGGLTAPLRHRMQALIGYAVPVLASDQSLFDAVADHVLAGATRVAVLGPVRAGVADPVARLRDRLRSASVTITGIVVDGAHQASGDRARLERLVVDAARRVEPDADLVVLGQLSISPAQPAAEAVVAVPVLSPTQFAADVLRNRLAAEAVA